jgi:hypothetical protein
MSTHSRIAVLQEKTGKVKSVYCHSDGYLSGVGKILHTHYNTYERANAIIKLGDLSGLYKYLDPLPEAPEAFYMMKDNPEILKSHSFEKPQHDVTIAYHRDRKAKLQRQNYRSLEDFYENNVYLSYNYLFKEGKWYVKKEHLIPKEWVELTSEMVESNG